jgi:hypothetical protein
VKGGHKDIVQLMIDNGAYDFGSGMVIAARHGHKDLVEFFMNDHDVNTDDSEQS